MRSGTTRRRLLGRMAGLSSAGGYAYLNGRSDGDGERAEVSDSERE